MESIFWHKRWEENEIGWHQAETNPLLAEFINELSLAVGSRIFIPLCGKTHDIAYLLSKGYRIAGSELNKPAVEQLFIELGIEPNISKLVNIDRYSAENIDIFVGDIFELSQEILGSVEAIYDRAALVALPEEMRAKYRSHLLNITDVSPQLLITFGYDQKIMPGPPFSISDADVKQYYEEFYKLSLLKKVDVPGGLKGKCDASESIWLLSGN